MPFAGLLVSKKLATALSTPFLVGQPSQLNIAAQLSVIWAPLLGAGQLPGAAELPAYLHPCFVNGAPFGPPPSGPPYSMRMDFAPSLSKEKRLSVISELDELFGNQPEPSVDTSLPVFQLQQLYSDFCEGEGKKFDCIQPGSGAGYYVVPAGDIALVPGQTYHVSITTNPLQGFFAPGGQVWQAEAAFEWLLATAFGP